MNIINFVNRQLIYLQFLPKKEDLENNDLISLSYLLKGKSKKNTLINVLEWQHNNLQYWIDRNVVYTILLIIVFFSIGFLNHFLKAKIPFYVLLIILIIVFFGDITLDLIYYFVSLFFLLVLMAFILAFNINYVSLTKDVFLIFVFSSFVLGSFLSILTYLFVKYKSIKDSIKDFEIADTFKLSLPVEKILKYRLSICRDYAKLTAALLLKIYPDDEVYFVLIPQHVALAVKYENKYFVLDQKLPIFRLEKWLDYWKDKQKRKKMNFSILKLNLEKNLLNLEPIKIELTNDVKEMNLNELKLKLLKSFSLKNLKSDEVKKIKDYYLIKINNVFPYDSEDELYFESLVEFIKNKIYEELVGNINNLVYIDIFKNKKNLLIKCYLSKNGNK
ncbi:MAG: transglutaminase-like domain-containing protein [Candidatus Woesearchaeota archaeon]